MEDRSDRRALQDPRVRLDRPDQWGPKDNLDSRVLSGRPDPPAIQDPQGGRDPQVLLEQRVAQRDLQVTRASQDLQESPGRSA